MPHPRRLACLALLLTAACGPGDPDGTTSDASTTATASSSTGTTADPTTAPTTTAATDSASASTSTTADPTTDPATTDPATTDPATTDPATTDPTTGDPTVCGERRCDAGQVCVLPCCGGPPPACTEPDGRGQCEGGQDPVPTEECQFNPCAGPLCCPPIACTADPPFCVAADALRCTDNTCRVDSCFGMLSGDTLECQCA